MYCLQDFKKSFININFDQLLIEQNNVLVESDIHYTELKNIYIYETNENYIKVKNLLPDFHNCSHNYSCKTNEQGTTRHVYNYTCKDELKQKNDCIKKIYINQKEIYKNFILYIDFINIYAIKKKN